MDEKGITELIAQFVKTDKKNSLPEFEALRIYEEPLVAFASAHDPLYEEFKDEKVIGPNHLLPTDWLPDARSVLVYFLPFTKEIVESNRLEGLPSGEWYLSRYWGEIFNDRVRDYVVDVLGEGHGAVAPARTERFEQYYAVTSNWSERHSAYAAGLGSFCLSYSFITEKGCAGRFGSVVTNAEFKPTPRTVSFLMENCIYDDNGTCGKCISRCPAGAISPDKKDHALCLDFIMEKIIAEYPKEYVYYAGGCGKCQTNVPCSMSNPKRVGAKS